jgi:hypothetical protein
METAKELKRDIEVGLLNDNPASAGTSTSPRVSACVNKALQKVTGLKTGRYRRCLRWAPV